MNPLINKPVFTLNLLHKNSSYVVEINGNIILDDYTGEAQMEATIPINQWMQSGINNISLYLLPKEPGDQLNNYTEHEIKLFVHTNDKSVNQEKHMITSIHYNEAMARQGKPFIYSSDSGKFDSTNHFTPAISGDVEVFDISKSSLENYKGAIRIHRVINIPSSLTKWEFFNSEDLPDYDAMPDKEYYEVVDSLIAEYQKVQNAISTGNIDPVLSMFEERNGEYEVAFYLEQGTFRKRVKRSLERMANDSNAKLLPLDRNYLNVQRFTNKKLARLVRFENKPKSAIVQNFIKGEGAVRFDLIFRRQDGKWILTR